MSDIEPAWLSAVEVARLVRGGMLDSQVVVQAHLEAIERLDRRIHAYIHVDRNAMAPEGEFSGVTMAVKDSQPVAACPTRTRHLPGRIGSRPTTRSRWNAPGPREWRSSARPTSPSSPA